MERITEQTGTYVVLCNIVNDIFYDEHSERFTVDFTPDRPRRVLNLIKRKASDDEFIDTLLSRVFDESGLSDERQEYHEFQLDENGEVVPRDLGENCADIYKLVQERSPSETVRYVENLYRRYLSGVVADLSRDKDVNDDLDYLLSVKANSGVKLEKKAEAFAKKSYRSIISHMGWHAAEAASETPGKVSRTTVQKVCRDLFALKRLRSLAGREFPERIPSPEVVLLHRILLADLSITYKADPGIYAARLLREFGEGSTGGLAEISKLYEERIAAGKEQDRYFWNSSEGLILTSYFDSYRGKEIQHTLAR